MAEDQTLQGVASKYSGASVATTAGEAERRQSATPPASTEVDPNIRSQAAPPQGSSDVLTSVAARYSGYDVETMEEAYQNNVADAGRVALERQPPRRQSPTEEHGILDWFGDVGRGTLFGAVADPIAALILTQTHREQGVTYRQAMDAIENQRAEKGESAVANIAGAFLGGGVVAQGLRRGATYAATRSGLARAGMQWAGKDKVLNRVVAAAATGAAAGAVEEGIRTSLEETIDATQGQGFDTQRVTDSVLLGALIGGAATPVLQEGLNGARWMGTWMKRQLGNDDAQTYQATSLVIRALARRGETPDETVGRFQDKVTRYTQRNQGRIPAAGEILKPEQVTGVAEIIKNFAGLDQRARKLGEQGVKRSLQGYDDLVRSGGEMPDPLTVQNVMSEAFNDVVERNGQTMVTVPDDAMGHLLRNKEFLRTLAVNQNEGAAAIVKVLDAQDNIQTIRRNYQAAISTVDNQQAFKYVNELKVQLEELVQREMTEGGADLSERQALKNLVNMQRNLANLQQSESQLNAATFRLQDMRGPLDAANRALEAYTRDGMQITLSDANQIRARASKMAFNPGANDNPEVARFVRDVVSKVGTDEVPEYADVVKRFNLENIRADAQPMGSQATRGDINAMELDTRLTKGLIQGRPKQNSPEQLAATREGAREGARRQLQDEMGGQLNQQLGAAQRMAGSRNAQRTTAMVLGNAPAKEIARSAKQVVKTYERMKALASPTSTSDLAEERKLASDVLTGAVFGSLGGAGRAALLNRMLTQLKIPRGTAEKVVEMLGDPSQIDKALNFMQTRGIRVGPMFSATLAHLSEPVAND